VRKICPVGIFKKVPIIGGSFGGLPHFWGGGEQTAPA